MLNYLDRVSQVLTCCLCYQVPVTPLLEQDELIWDDGTANPEPAVDDFPLVSKWQALGYLMGGMAFYATLGTAVKLSKPEAHR